MCSGQSIELLRQVLRHKGILKLPASGSSMHPLIREGDICTFVPATIGTIRKGEIVLFAASGGELIVHRCCGIVTVGQSALALFKGDANRQMDDPVETEQIIGKLVQINALDTARRGLFLRMRKALALYFREKVGL